MQTKCNEQINGSLGILDGLQAFEHHTIWLKQKHIYLKEIYMNSNGPSGGFVGGERERMQFEIKTSAV